MINCKDLTIKYDNDIGVKNLNLQIEASKTCSIVGQSGCGKTTLLHGIAGLLPATSGSIQINKEDLEGIRKDTAVILQKDGLFPWKNVEDNVAIALLQKDLTKDWRVDRVLKVLDELQIGNLKDRYLNDLSGGQRQRVAIARALVQEPDLLLMDEPTGALDMITKESFQDLLMALHKKHQMTMVLVTHDIEEAVFLGQKIVAMHQGEVLEVIDNPLFGQENLRERIDFYELCLKVRRVLKV